MNNRNNSRNWLALGFGLLAGGALGYYLNTDKGRAMRKKVSEEVKKNADYAAEKLSQTADQVKNQVSHLAEQAQSSISSITSNAQEAVDSMEDSFEKGAERAKKKTKRASNHISELVDSDQNS